MGNVFLKERFTKGIYTIQDLLNEDGWFLTYEEFQFKYQRTTNFFEYF